MDNDTYLNLVDEIDLSISAYVRDANRVAELVDISDMNGEAPNPYETLLRQLEYSKKVIDDHIKGVKFLAEHKCEYDEYQFCKYCGRDGTV